MDLQCVEKFIIKSLYHFIRENFKKVYINFRLRDTAIPSFTRIHFNALNYRNK